MSVLVTGGIGYIGSHACVELLNAGYDVVALDDLSNSKLGVLQRIEKITGKEVTFYKTDAQDEKAMDEVFAQNDIEAVIHFAGLKAVGESVEKPLKYYSVNIGTAISVLNAMRRANVYNIAFSSSATVYGIPDRSPVKEGVRLDCANPYGWTKMMIEQIMRDVCVSDANMSAVLLRYFNPVGAHPSGLIGEDPQGIPNNLMPYISQVAVGRRKYLNVFGNDYDTMDGTGVRDYIHVVDLAKGHVKAIEYAKRSKGARAINLGTGRGYSVLEVVRAFERANGMVIPYRIASRRPGDIDIYYADATLAKELLDYKAELSIEDMCRDAWTWQKNNPYGYEK